MKSFEPPKIIDRKDLPKEFQKKTTFFQSVTSFFYSHDLNQSRKRGPRIKKVHKESELQSGRILQSERSHQFEEALNQSEILDVLGKERRLRKEHENSEINAPDEIAIQTAANSRQTNAFKKKPAPEQEQEVKYESEEEDQEEEVAPQNPEEIEEEEEEVEQEEVKKKKPIGRIKNIHFPLLNSASKY